MGVENADGTLVRMHPIAPIDAIQLDGDLDGSTGTNRAVGAALISATNDVAAVQAWLAKFHNRRATLESYRKEAERLLLWSVIELGKPLSSLTHEDFLVYQRFIAELRPGSRWVLAAGQKKVSRMDPAWRPFAGPLSSASQRQTMVILNVMFSWLVTAGYLRGNPLALQRERQRRAVPRVTRYLEHDIWDEVKATISAMPQETDRERAKYFRVRWLFSLLYIGGLRISEVVGNTMGGFFRRRDKEGEERWWLEVLGKGGKIRLVVATDELMVELARYRRENGLAPSPAPGEDIPLLFRITNDPLQRRRPLTRAAVHEIVKDIFEATAKRLRERDQEAAAQTVESASAHWLRHTSGTHMMDNNIDVRQLRDNLGHESIATTNIYAHQEDDERHKQIEEKHHLGW